MITIEKKRMEKQHKKKKKNRTEHSCRVNKFRNIREPLF